MKEIDNQIEDMFEEQNLSKKLLKKAKRRVLIRNATISIVIFSILSFFMLVGTGLLLNLKAGKVMAEEELFYQITRPNTYITNSQLNDNFLTGEMEYSTYKLLDFTPIYSGTYKRSYSLLPIFPIGMYGSTNSSVFQVWKDSHKNEFQYYNKMAQKVMNFYPPQVDYLNIESDIETIDNLSEDTLVEVAISFDKAYSVEEVVSMLPNGMIPSWYWVNTLSEDIIKSLESRENTYIDENGIEQKSEGMIEATPLNANQVYGFDGIDSLGSRLEDPVMRFINALEAGVQIKGSYLSEYERIMQQLKKGNEDLKVEQIEIIGIVVTGRAIELVDLKSAPYTRASSFGITQ